MKYGILIFALLYIIGCQNDPAPQLKNIDKAFFNLDAYFDTEIKKNQSEIKSISKTTAINQDSATITLSNIDFAKELKLFRESDINKTSWIDRYKTDTLKQSATEYQITYTALTDNLQAREITIDFLRDAPQKIYIHNQLKSMIMDIDQYLTYEANSGYSVSIKQIGKLQQGNDYYTSVTFD